MKYLLVVFFLGLALVKGQANNATYYGSGYSGGAGQQIQGFKLNWNYTELKDDIDKYCQEGGSWNQSANASMSAPSGLAANATVANASIGGQTQNATTRFDVIVKWIEDNLKSEIQNKCPACAQ